MVSSTCRDAEDPVAQTLVEAPAAHPCGLYHKVVGPARSLCSSALVQKAAKARPTEPSRLRVTAAETATTPAVPPQRTRLAVPHHQRGKALEHLVWGFAYWQQHLL